MSITLETILEAAEQHQASDVFLQEGEIPSIKINEQIGVLGDEPLDRDQMALLWQRCGASTVDDMDRDSGLISHAQIRFRVNLHRTMGRLGAVLRRIKTTVPSLDSLGVPDWLLARWATRTAGLILVTGPTGSGKSTTIAALIQWINENTSRHIVTIEDPVEYVFHRDQSHITQREVGTDTRSFANGLRSAMRQAPDVIFVGEIRDYETALIALQASETGHLVLSTLHSERVADTVERYLSLFPADLMTNGLHLLSQQLCGVLCQKLLPTPEGGLHLLVEHVENGGAMREWIARREITSIDQYLARNTDPAAVSFLRSAISALHQKRISEETAMAVVSNPAELRRSMRGVA